MIIDPSPSSRAPLGVPPSSRVYIIPGASNNNLILEDPLTSLTIIQEAPDTPNKIEKRAARLIVIRRTKMNKHKLRKLRKKMHFKWLKVNVFRFFCA
jgi:hypothetical protein